MQAETPVYPKQIEELFAPKRVIKFVEPTDYTLDQRRLPIVSSIGSFLKEIKKYNTEVIYESSEGVQQKEQRLKKEKQSKQQEKLTTDLLNWDPLNDPHIHSSDPYKTIFVGRLDYKVSELELQQFFSKYGTIKKLRLVRDKLTSKSRGYAFIEFESEQVAKSCYKETNGQKILDRPILVDFERSRLIKNWKPRRLGGGLGGRNYTQRAKVDAVGASGFQRGNRSFTRGPPTSGRFNSRPHDSTPYDRNAPRRYATRGGGVHRGYSGGGSRGFRTRY